MDELIYPAARQGFQTFIVTISIISAGRLIRSGAPFIFPGVMGRRNAGHSNTPLPVSAGYIYHQQSQPLPGEAQNSPSRKFGNISQWNTNKVFMIVQYTFISLRCEDRGINPSSSASSTSFCDYLYIGSLVPQHDVDHPVSCSYIVRPFKRPIASQDGKRSSQ